MSEFCFKPRRERYHDPDAQTHLISFISKMIQYKANMISEKFRLIRMDLPDIICTIILLKG